MQIIELFRNSVIKKSNFSEFKVIFVLYIIQFDIFSTFLIFIKLNFYGLVENERGNTSDGGSIIEDHNSTMYKADVENSITVDSISFSKLIS